MTILKNYNVNKVCKDWRKTVLIAAFVCLTGAANTQTTWPVIKQEARPWTRWWWMGSAVDEKNISAQLSTYKTAGFGGVEIVPIYGAMGYEKQYVPYLSPQWMKMLDHIRGSFDICAEG